MKARVFNHGQVCLSLIFCLFLTSCNKDDFFEKEFLENPFQEPTTTGTVNSGEQGGSTSGTDAGTQGGVDGGVNGGTSGSTTGGSTTGGTDGSTTGGTDGSTTGGTDGSTTGGTDGSTTGGTDGSTTGGVTGGSTTGGTTGGSTGGTTGGSTGGSTGCSNNGHGNNMDGVDSSNPGNGQGGPNGSIDQSGNLDDEMKGCGTPVKEVFQQSNDTKKIDIVWVIDNSGSMADEQHALGVNFNAFIQDFIHRNVDFRMAITTTDTTSRNNGLMVSGSLEKLNSQAAQSNPTRFMDDFRNMVKVGTRGSGSEKGLEASEGFMNRYSQTFLRPEAYLAVVIISDEEDQSPKSPTEYTDYLKSFKSEAGLVKVYSIVDVNRTNSGNGIATGYERYAKASQSTAGVVGNIRDDFYHVLNSMGESLINLLDSFALADEPIQGTLKVKINGVEVNDYTYDSASHSIKFDQGSLPPVGAEIEVSYLK